MTGLMWVFLLVWCVAAPAWAQEPVHEHGQPSVSGDSSSGAEWVVATDASVITGFNYQQRRYFDFAAWEAQNWFMATATRQSPRGQFTVHGMLSLEPLTIGRYVYQVDGDRFDAGGSPQLFQTGESYKRLPLVGFQHPHDLIMGLGVTYQRSRQRVTYTLGADVVGSPTIGPLPFMHRESARNNPQAPLSHHLIDSTHITPGVIRGGVGIAGWQFDASVFRGEEPDEQRYDIDQPRLDSWAARVGWRKGGWQAQFSGAHLHEPEWYAPWDQTRLTASIGYSGTFISRPLAVTAAAGQTREVTPELVVSQGALVEWDWRAFHALTTYGRAEAVRKEVLGVHVHQPGVPHPHFLSDIGAFTVGAVHDLTFLGLDRQGRFGIGGDVTFYAMSNDLQPIYGGSASFHVFVRWRPRAGASAGAEHVH